MSFIEYGNWFDVKYGKKLDSRWATMKAAMNLALQRGGKNWIETGCARMAEDFGAGLSTVLFCEVLSESGGHLWSIDNNAHHLKICQGLTKGYEAIRTLVHSDSVDALKAADKLPGFTGKIGLLYLDSWDYPIGEIWNEYGGTQDLEKAIKIVNELPDLKIFEQFGHLINPCQDHCLKELIAALPHCDEKTVIMIDDVNLKGGGKGRTAKLWLAENGYECILDHQQSLWIHS